MSGLYPIFMALAGKKCVVAGGGAVAARKIGGLLEAGAAVTVVSPQLSPEARRVVADGAAEWIEGMYHSSILDSACLAIAATGDAGVNSRISQDCQSRGIPVNVVDQPELCSFFVPSIVRRGGLAIAISTSGASPAVAKRIRKKLEADFGPEWEPYLELMGAARAMAQDMPGNQKDRERVFNLLADSDLFDLVKSGEMDMARKRIEEIVRA